MAQILDRFGRPLNREVLKSPQTARVAQITRHFPEHPSRGLSIRRLPRILEAAECGDLSAQADLFEDMIEKDGHIFSEMSKRKNAPLGLDWSIEPPRNATAEEKNLTAMLTEWVDDIANFEDIISTQRELSATVSPLRKSSTGNLRRISGCPTESRCACIAGSVLTPRLMTRCACQMAA